MIKSLSIVVNNFRLHYLEQGNGDTTLFFGHGTLISSNIWRDFYFPILPQDWHAIAADFRGHGASASVKTGCNFIQMADDVAAMVKELKLGKIIYVGLSMGGGVGLQLALSHPEILKGLVLISTVTGLGPLGNPAFLHFGKYTAGKKALLRYGLKSASTRKPDPVALEKVVDEAMLVSKQTLTEYLSPFNKIACIDKLPDIKIPVLLLIGLMDKVIPVKQQLLLSKTIPGCQCFTYKDCGHALAAENPTQIVTKLTDFINNIS